MKKYVRDIMIFVFGLITAGSIGVAAYNYNANNIEYSPSDKTWKVSTVAEAINSLVNDTKGSVMNYSEEEQVVGTWIDGKSLYQKSIIIDPFSLTQNQNHTILTLDDYINVVDISGYVIEDNNRYFLNDLSLRVAVYSNTIKFGSAGSWRVSSGVLTLQYTKTTDTGNSNNS